MKKCLFLSFLFTTFFIQAQIFNRSKPGTLGAVPFQLNGALYTVDNFNINKVDSKGDIISTWALPYLNVDRFTKKVLIKNNGNVLIAGHARAACDVFTDISYFVYEYSPQFNLVDSAHRMVNVDLSPIELLELDANRYFILTYNGYALLDVNYDTIQVRQVLGFGDVQTAVYLGGNEVLINSNTWASSTPVYTIVDVLNDAAVNWMPVHSGSAFSVSDTTFGLCNLNNGDVFTYAKNTRVFLDSNRISMPTTFSIDRFQSVKDGFVLRGDSGLAAYNSSDLSTRGMYETSAPLNRGEVSVVGNQLFYYYQDDGFGVSDYHVYEVGQLNQPASNFVKGIELTSKNTHFEVSTYSQGGGAPDLYIVNTDWEITVKNNGLDVLDSVRLVWSDPLKAAFCFDFYAELKNITTKILVGDSLVIPFTVTFGPMSAPSGTAQIYFNVAAVMANGKVVSDDARVSSSKLIENISLSEVAQLATLKLYPNPASNRIFIESVESILFAEIVNLQGQNVRTFTSKTELSELSVEGLAKGIYLVKLRSATAETIKKILVE